MQDGPMPMKDLPDYVKSVRDNGQSDDVPVVEMGRIVTPNRKRPYLLAAAASLFLALGGVYVATSTGEIEIVSPAGPQEVANMVSEEGGRVLSVRRDDDGTYRVRVFTTGRMSLLLDRLRGKENLDSVRLGD